MKQYRYVVINNAGHSWAVMSAADLSTDLKDQNGTLAPQLLQEGWVPVRETPMGGGTSQLAHSLVLLEKEEPPAAAAKPARARTAKG
jgi:hypothetical protein